MDIALRPFPNPTSFGFQLPKKKGQAHRDNKVRTVHLPPRKSISGWDISPFRDRWDLIERVLNGDESNAKRM
jgi:hypothetical protein